MKQVEILINPVRAQILTLDSGLVQILDNHFKYKDSKKLFGKKSKELIAKGLTDEYKHLFSTKTLRLPIGLVDEAIDLIKKEGFEVVIEDLRKKPEFDIPDNYDSVIEGSGKEFRYYQKECFDAILKKEKFNGVIEGATGFGKTLVFLALTRMIKGKILIIFPGVDLVFQTRKAAKKLGFTDVGLISGQSAILNKRVMLVNYQSMEKVNDFKEYTSVIVDEMHTAKANTLYNFLKKIPATLRLGFSATPYVPFKSHELDNALNKASFGEKIYVKKADALIKEGFLSKVNINFISIRKPYNISFDDHITAVEKGVVNNEYRNNIIIGLANKDKKKTLIMVERREHGQLLKDSIPESIYVNGDTEKQDREKIAESLNSGEVRVVISSRIWNTGVDIPELEKIIMAASGKSFYQCLQRVGRGLRKTETSDELEMWDFVDYTNKFLLSWSKMRWKVYRSENYPIKSVKIEEIIK